MYAHPNQLKSHLKKHSSKGPCCLAKNSEFLQGTTRSMVVPASARCCTTSTCKPVCMVPQLSIHKAAMAGPAARGPSCRQRPHARVCRHQEPRYREGAAHRDHLPQSHQGQVLGCLPDTALATAQQGMPPTRELHCSPPSPPDILRIWVVLCRSSRTQSSRPFRLTLTASSSGSTRKSGSRWQRVAR